MMAELGQGVVCEGPEALAEPVSAEAAIPGDGIGKEEALKNVEDEKEKLEAVEEMLPKLSASDFRVYNHMAENMNYYVRPRIDSLFRLCIQMHSRGRDEANPHCWTT